MLLFVCFWFVVEYINRSPMKSTLKCGCIIIKILFYMKCGGIIIKILFYVPLFWLQISLFSMLLIHRKYSDFPNETTQSPVQSRHPAQSQALWNMSTGGYLVRYASSGSTAYTQTSKKNPGYLHPLPFPALLQRCKMVEQGQWMLSLGKGEACDTPEVTGPKYHCLQWGMH